MPNKQNKHLNKINYETGNTIAVAKNAQKNRDDEFYTNMNDIAQELNHYGREHFEGKDIICPCDWDVVEDENIYSLCIEFYDTGKPQLWNPKYTVNAVKKIIYKTILFEPVEHIETYTIEGEQANEFINKRITCNFVRYLIGIAKKYGVHSITASGYDPDLNKGVKFQDVDYSKYNLCITNPPFSVYGEFMEYMIKEVTSRKNTSNPFHFILLAPFLNRVNPNVGLNLMLENCYLGYGRRCRLNFVNPTKANDYSKKSVACDWITTFRDAQDEIDKLDIYTGITWDVYHDDYYECTNMTMLDGTHPIKIEEITAIPEDYTGWMFSSVGVLDILPYSKFEWYGTNFMKYWNTDHPEKRPFAHRTSNAMVSDEEHNNFHGIVFRRKK